MGFVFAVILMFQYVELPYGNVLTSLFSTDKVTAPTDSSSRTDGALNNSEMIANLTHENSFNSTNSYPFHEMVNNTETSEGENRNLDSDIVSKGSKQLNSSGFDEANNVKQSSSEKMKNSLVDNINHFDNISSVPSLDELREDEQGFSPQSETDDNDYTETENTILISQSERTLNDTFASSSSLSTKNSSSNLSLPQDVITNASTPFYSLHLKTPPGENIMKSTSKDNETLGKLQSNFTISGDNSSLTVDPKVNRNSVTPKSAVTTIAEMKKLLHQNHASHHSVTPRWSSAVDQDLTYARSQIENAPIIKNDPALYAPLYWNISMFKRSYELMENMLKVYIYKEGKKPIMHMPVLKGIYASEGWFMKLLEVNKKFVVRNPGKAHLFYLPFSSRMLEETLYIRDSHSHKNLIQFLKEYLDLISARYPFWNRTEGADHFLVACHDWAPAETRKFMANCIRALCNSDVKEGFVFGKDASLPETNVRVPQKPLRDLGGKPSSERKTLAFFAGKMHGYLRPILLQHWGGNKDPDMKIFGPLPKVKGQKNYIQFMKSSKYCICAKGYEVNSPRVVEAIFYECVLVIISDNFVPPFYEVLNWESFAVFVLEEDIPNLKKILLSIPEKRYREMQMRVKRVQQHFLWHSKPVKYDIFHMILHSVWYNRVFQV